MTVMDRVIGQWSVQNPDRGESLRSDDARMLIGGSYHFLTGGLVNVNIRYRDRHGAIHPEKWVATFSAGDGDRIVVDFLGGHREVYRLAPDDLLVRESTTRQTAESGLTLRRPQG